MDCCNLNEELSVNSNKLLSDTSLLEKKKRLNKEAREQCCFCMLFTGAATGSTVVSTASHGSTLPADIPSIIVSTSSAFLCFKQYLNKRSDINEINNELEYRKRNNVAYVDNLSNLSIYSKAQDSIHKIHYPIIPI